MLLVGLVLQQAATEHPVCKESFTEHKSQSSAS